MMQCKAQHLFPGDCITISDTPKLMNSIAVVMSRRPTEHAGRSNDVLIDLLVNVGGALSMVSWYFGRDEKLTVIEKVTL